MSFCNDLVDVFTQQAGEYNQVKDEEFLFGILANAVCDAAKNNGYLAHKQVIHQSFVNFAETDNEPFYRAKDRGESKCCELADIMFIVYNYDEARLCFMQNKYDRRRRRNHDFRADTRQLYLLKKRPEYWVGKKHKEDEKSEKILRTAKYTSITNYGVFAWDKNKKKYSMEYYNANIISPPTKEGKSCVVKFEEKSEKYNKINNSDEELNYAFDLKEFGQGLSKMKIGEKYKNLDDLLKAINVKDVIEYFKSKNYTDVVYDSARNSVLARCIVIVNFE